MNKTFVIQIRDGVDRWHDRVEFARDEFDEAITVMRAAHIMKLKGYGGEPVRLVERRFTDEELDSVP